MQLSYRWSQVYTAVSNVFIKNLTNPDFGNTFCWFSVNAVEDRNEDYGCSPVATCNAGTYIQDYKYTSFHVQCIICIHAILIKKLLYLNIEM